MLSGPLNTLPLTSTSVNPENGPIDPGGYVCVILFVEPSYVSVSFLILAKLLVGEVADLLNPATCINAPVGGTGELKVIVTGFARMGFVKSVLGNHNLTISTE